MNELGRRKDRLLEIEKSLKSFIEMDSTELEAELKKYLKTGAIVGSALVVGYTVYKMLENGNEQDQVEKIQTTPYRNPPFSFRKRFGALIFTFIYNEFTKRLKQGKKEIEKSLDEEN